MSVCPRLPGAFRKIAAILAVSLVLLGSSLLLSRGHLGIAFAGEGDGLTRGAPAWAPDRSIEDDVAAFGQSDPLLQRLNQSQRLSDSLGDLLDHRPGVTDLYFVGFASFGAQDVFMREVGSIRTLFDERLDTQGRSVTLVNNFKTLHSLPLANISNLETALSSVAERIDQDEDVLFLYLTSHGSRDHRLAVEFWPLQLPDLTADRLRAILDASGIRWRVIVVSACFSGGFIEPLQTDHSLIMTAARADRSSFGCAHENEFTYFGQAYFDEALRETYSFEDAFDVAVRSIDARERDEDLTPSEPQIFVGAVMREKLTELETRLRRNSSTVNAASGASTE